MNKRIAAAAALLLLLGGCSDPQGVEPGEAAATTAGDAGAGGSSPGDEDGATVAPSDAPGDDGAGSGPEDSAGGDGAGNGDGGNGAGESGGGGDASGGDASDYMAAGDYVYDQKGFERLCSGPSCDKQPLPDTATITATYESESGDGATIVTEARSSDRQTVTTTTRHTPDAALITKVVIDFAYSGFSFSQTYEPKPPIVSLSFPLEPGKTWRGRWKAQTSGDYRMKVLGVSEGVYRIHTVTNFRGEFSGRAQATVWVDGDTRAIIRTDGQIAVASRFGEYTSDFRTTLRSAPGS